MREDFELVSPVVCRTCLDVDSSDFRHIHKSLFMYVEKSGMSIEVASIIAILWNASVCR
jgi:hypothetical protein